MNPQAAKIVALLALGFGSFVIGLVPAALSRYNLRRNLVLQSVLLCFGAGVLLATSVVHMLPEVREGLENNLAEIVFCIGFLIVYLSEELLHFFSVEGIQHSHGSFEDETRPILQSNRQNNRVSYGSNEQEHNTSCEEHQHRSNTQSETSNARTSHTIRSEPYHQTWMGIIGMLTALSIHALLEGLAIGVQETTPKVMILFTAVISHKLIVAFCLGAELTATRGYQFKFHFAAIVVFSAGSVLGIGIGMGLVDLNSVTQSKFLPILQGLAGGTLLHVCLCEILVREKSRSNQGQLKRTMGLLQFLAFSAGFAVMTSMIVLITEEVRARDK